MPLTRLTATAIDHVRPQRQQFIDEVAGYAATDLVCYRADRPPALVDRQQAIWQPLVDWATLRYDAPLVVTTGVVPRRQPAAALASLRAAVETCDLHGLTALHGATMTTGSLVVGLALLDRRVDAAGAWEASQLDETFQIEAWGEDSEAAARRQAMREDLGNISRYMMLVRS